jgi:hypothetical protein
MPRPPPKLEPSKDRIARRRLGADMSQPTAIASLIEGAAAAFGRSTSWSTTPGSSSSPHWNNSGREMGRHPGGPHTSYPLWAMLSASRLIMEREAVEQPNQE